MTELNNRYRNSGRTSFGFGRARRARPETPVNDHEDSVDPRLVKLLIAGMVAVVLYAFSWTLFVL